MDRLSPLALAAALLAGCGASSTSKHACDPVAQTGCSAPQTCEAVSGGAPACFDPVVVQGAVFDLAQTAATAPIAGARVVALDANGAPLTAVATSAADGSYALQVPAARDATGAPVSSAQVTLRADARGYQSFPGGLRIAIPIALSSAVHQGGTWTISGAPAQLGLAKLSDATLTASLHGTVAVPPGHPGVLVVAEHPVQLTDPSTGTATSVVQGTTAIADRDGSYAIFNLAPDTYAVRALAQGSSFESKSQALAASQDAQVDLARTGDATAVVSGGVNAVSGASGPTSVILGLRSTFDDPFGTGLPLGRAVSVAGLRASLASVGDPATITGVPDGDYVVLAAFEDDGLVRQVSGQGGTQPVYVTVAGGNVSFSPPKIVPAVTLVGPGADPTATTPPDVAAPLVFSWSYGNASATRFDLRLYDTYGTLVWSKGLGASGAFDATTAFAGPCNGSAPCTYAYDGPALTSGMTYQVRITGWGTNAATWVPYSRTEDLLGVFTWKP